MPSTQDDIDLDRAEARVESAVEASQGRLQPPPARETREALRVKAVEADVDPSQPFASQLRGVLWQQDPVGRQ